MKRKIDATDRMILTELQKNARISIKNLAEIVNLSGPAVARRIQQLEDVNIIRGYQTMIDASSLGYGVQGYIILSVQKLELKRFLQKIEPLEEIISCETIVAGGKELILKFVCRDNDHLMELYDKLPYNFIEDMTAFITMPTPDKQSIIHLRNEI